MEMPSSPPFNLNPPPLPPPPSDDRRDNRNHERERLRERRMKLLSELIFPPHVPKKCHAKIEGMVKLIQDLDLMTNDERGAAGGRRAEGSTFSREEWDRMERPDGRDGSPLDEVRHAAERCEVFRRKANESRLKLEGARREQQRQAALSSNTAGEKKGAADSSVAAESAPIAVDFVLKEEAARTTIHEQNYRVCLAETTCPGRMRQLMACWRYTDPEIMQELAQADMTDIICSNEREAVERCNGMAVQRLMRLALG